MEIIRLKEGQKISTVVIIVRIPVTANQSQGCEHDKPTNTNC